MPLEIWHSQPIIKKLDDGREIQNNVHFGHRIVNMAGEEDLARITKDWAKK